MVARSRTQAGTLARSRPASQESTQTQPEEPQASGSGDTTTQPPRNDGEPPEIGQLHDPVEPSAEILSLTEAGLDERIALAQQARRLQRKRDYLAAIENGEQPDINPYEFDEPTSRATPVIHDEPPAQRPRHSYSSSALKGLPTLRYKGTDDYTELQNFLFELEGRFATYRDDFREDLDKVTYATGALQGHIKTRWRNFVTSEHLGGITTITWGELKEWLLAGVTDDVTRSLEVVAKLQRLQQREDQPFRQFQELYETLENQLGYELPMVYRVCSFLVALKHDLRKQIISMGIPGTRQELNITAYRAESLLYSGQSQQRSQYRPQATSQPVATPTPLASAQTPAAPPLNNRPPDPSPLARPNPGLVGQMNQLRVSCYRCAQPGHYANLCPMAKCGRCGKMGHSESKCSDAPLPPRSGPNAIPLVRHTAPDP